MKGGRWLLAVWLLAGLGFFLVYVDVCNRKVKVLTPLAGDSENHRRGGVHAVIRYYVG